MSNSATKEQGFVLPIILLLLLIQLIYLYTVKQRFVHLQQLINLSHTHYTQSVTLEEEMLRWVYQHVAPHNTAYRNKLFCLTCAKGGICQVRYTLIRQNLTLTVVMAEPNKRCATGHVKPQVRSWRFWPGNGSGSTAAVQAGIAWPKNSFLA